jgi:NAD(P)-dependent dehydrogenase (short-subunit alcohol dehydrogenase family)
MDGRAALAEFGIFGARPDFHAVADASRAAPPSGWRAAGLVGHPGLPAYVASKHGVVGLTRAAALEYAKQNLRINAVCPDAIRTSMLEDAIRGALFSARP